MSPILPDQTSPVSPVPPAVVLTGLLAAWPRPDLGETYLRRTVRTVRALDRLYAQLGGKVSVRALPGGVVEVALAISVYVRGPRLLTAVTKWTPLDDRAAADLPLIRDARDAVTGQPAAVALLHLIGGAA